jgi:hypothetical protein
MMRQSYGCKRKKENQMSALKINCCLLLTTALAVVPLAIAQNRDTAPGSAANPTGALSSATDTPPVAAPANGQTKPSERLRENTRLVDVAGTFQAIGGDSVAFQPSGGKDSLRVLENLALERISRSLEDNRGSKWTVSGLVTEYRGSNYLLVTKAVTQQQEADAAANR